MTDEEAKVQVEKIGKELKVFDKKIRALLTDEYEELYKGAKFLFSPIHIKPKIMLLGINCGDGLWKNIGEKEQEFKPLKNHEYIEDGWYRLAQQWVQIFESIDRKDLLENSVKSNYYYFATTNTKDLYKLRTFLNNNTENEFEEKAEDWTKRLISYIQPEILICEGKTVYDKLLEIYPDEMHKKSTKIEHIFKADLNNIKVIGCERNQSSLLNPEGIIKVLKKYIG